MTTKIDERDGKIRCHYDVLGVERDADPATIKKSHRKMALKYHPDKNLGDETAAEQFRLIQQAYECLSDPQERKWYDDHRDAILAGWSASGTASGPDDASKVMLFDVVPYMYAGCYSGYHNGKGGFYQVYSSVFVGIVACERKSEDALIDEVLPTTFGDNTSDWSNVVQFYQAWESFSSALNFAWEDKYNVMEDAPNRRIRRLMEDDNRKARRAAKKTYNADILALVQFVKRRDPRVKAKQEQLALEKAQREEQQKQQAKQRKEEQQKAKQVWLEQAQLDMELAEEEDRLAGRVRLADLEDDYDYGAGNGKGKKKKRGGKKNKKNRWQQQEQDKETKDVDEEASEQQAAIEETEVDTEGESTQMQNDESVAEERSDALIETDAENANCTIATTDVLDDNINDESEEESEPDVWRCECCRKDFKSEGQMENHMKSKKHKEAFKKHQAKVKKQEEDIMNEMIGDMALKP